MPTEDEVLRLIAEIRQMDNLIFQMGQCDSWERMRPIFASLHERMLARKEAESRRIQALMIPEIRKAYLLHPATRSISTSHNLDPIPNNLITKESK